MPSSQSVALDWPVIHAIVLNGGEGKRLGGVDKASLDVGGKRLLDVVSDGISPFVTGMKVLVAPEISVRGHSDETQWQQTMENPPGGGPMAGIAAGVAALSERGELTNYRTATISKKSINKYGDMSIHSYSWVFVFSIDTPGIAALAPLLLSAMEKEPARDGAVIFGGEPPFRQYLQAIYRCDALQQKIDALPTAHGRGVTGVLRDMDLVDVPVSLDLCRDIDNPADVAWWQEHFADVKVRGTDS